MQLKQLLIVPALLSPICALATPKAADSFPPNVSTGVLNIQNYINGVINDIVQLNTKNIALDYSSTGRSLAFLERDILPAGCKQNLPSPAKTANEAIGYLQSVQLALSNVSLDAINNDLPKAQTDVCVAVNTYGGVAAYVQAVRTT